MAAAELRLDSMNRTYVPVRDSTSSTEATISSTNEKPLAGRRRLGMGGAWFTADQE